MVLELVLDHADDPDGRSLDGQGDGGIGSRGHEFELPGRERGKGYRITLKLGHLRLEPFLGPDVLLIHQPEDGSSATGAADAVLEGDDTRSSGGRFGSSRSWRCTAQQPGLAQIRLQHLRSWQPTDPGRYFRLSVKVAA